MSQDKTVVASGGIGFFGLLQVVMIALKLTGNLETWSWWWVFLPLWVNLGIIATLLAIFFGFIALAHVVR